MTKGIYDWILLLLMSAAGIVMGLYYVIVPFGKTVVDWGGIAILIATVTLLVSGIRGKRENRGTEKGMVAFLTAMQMLIMYCWTHWFGSVAGPGVAVHVLVLALGVVYLVYLFTTSSNEFFA